MLNVGTLPHMFKIVLEPIRDKEGRINKSPASLVEVSLHALYMLSWHGDWVKGTFIPYGIAQCLGWHLTNNTPDVTV